MTVSLAERLWQYLIDEGEASDPDAGAGAWPLFLGTLPDGDDVADEALAIYDTSGETDGRIMRTGETIEHPGFQLRVRSSEYRTGFAKAKELATKMDGIRNVTVTIDAVDYVIKSVSRRGTILVLGQEPEGKRRQGFTLNGIATL